MNKLRIKTTNGLKIKARLTDEQVEFLISIAADNGISIKGTGVYSPVQEEEEAPTPITDETLIEVSRLSGRSLVEIVQHKTSLGVETLEEVLEHNEVPQEIKSIVEGLL